MYSQEEATKATLEYFNGNELATGVFVKKYSLKDNDGNILEKTPDDMHRRLAREFARVEAKKFKNPLSEDQIYEYFKDFKRIIPQGSPMTGIGNPYQFVTLSNCYVVPPPEDSYGSIAYTDELILQISKRRGGNGTDLSNLRPVDSPTKNAAKSSTGVPSFAERYSNSIREVGQKNRRGALMMTLDVHHPDIVRFATMKNDDKSVTGANISVRLTDEFMNAAVKTKSPYEVRFPVDYRTKGVVPLVAKSLDASVVWQTIIKSAHLRAEPGLLFWDNIIRESIPDCYSAFGFRTVSTNPCSEIPLSILDSCRLLAMNLFAYVRHAFTSKAYFDYKAFYVDAQIAQRLMDDLIDLEIECIERIIGKIESDPEDIYVRQRELDLWKRVKDTCIRGRRTGTGITALGDTIAALGLKYGSKKCVSTVNDIYKVLKFGCYRSSVDMAKELGAFPIWNHDLEKNNPFLNRIKDEEITTLCEPDCGVCDDCNVVLGKTLWRDMQKYGRRNIALLTTAPTGSISLLACMEINGKKYFGTTSGIEPCFMPSYTRRRKINHDDKDAKVDFTDNMGDKWTEYKIYHEGINAYIDVTGKKYEDSPYFGASADEIDWLQRVKLQSVAQKHIDHAISSTINLPEDVSVEMVAEIYETAWAEGLKGITVYRKGSRSGVLVESPTAKSEGIHHHDAPERPSEVPCDVHHVSVKGKKYFVLVGLLNGEPYEVFAGRGNCLDKTAKDGIIYKVRKNKYKAVLNDETELSPVTLGCDEHEEALTRMSSIALRHGAPVQFIVEQLNKVDGDINSFAKAIARSLKKYIGDGTKSAEDCMECGALLVFEGGCQTCKNCGWAKC